MSIRTFFTQLSQVILLSSIIARKPTMVSGGVRFIVDDRVHTLVGVPSDYPCIVTIRVPWAAPTIVTNAAMDQSTPELIQAALRHEVGHLLQRDTSASLDDQEFLADEHIVFTSMTGLDAFTGYLEGAAPYLPAPTQYLNSQRVERLRAKWVPLLQQ